MTVGELVSWICTYIHERELDWNSEIGSQVYDWKRSEWKDVSFASPTANGGQLLLLNLGDYATGDSDKILEVFRELGRKGEMYWTEYKGLDGASHPEMRGSDYVQGLVDGMDEALDVVEEIFGHVDMERRRG